MSGVALRHTFGQLVRFSLVGGSGYVVNLGVFALFVKTLHVDHRGAAVAAFLVAVTNNFFWNRHWTFDARAGHAGHQASRFLAVSVGAFLVSLLILELLVSGGTPELVSQAIAIVAVTPLSFAGNRLWSFKG